MDAFLSHVVLRKIPDVEVKSWQSSSKTNKTAKTVFMGSNLFRGIGICTRETQSLQPRKFRCILPEQGVLQKCLKQRNDLACQRRPETILTFFCHLPSEITCYLGHLQTSADQDLWSLSHWSSKRNRRCPVSQHKKYTWSNTSKKQNSKKTFFCACTSITGDMYHQCTKVTRKDTAAVVTHTEMQTSGIDAFANLPVKMSDKTLSFEGQIWHLLDSFHTTNTSSA